MTNDLQDVTQTLNAAQQEAVRHVDGPMLVVAGPGSGKTRVITHRIAWLLAEGIPARSIVALTFTNKAAEEMRNRLAEMAPGQPVWLGTFHRFASRLLRRYAGLIGLSENFSICDVDDSKRLLRDAIEASGLPATHLKIGDVVDEISRAKAHVITPDKYEPRPGSAIGGVVREIYPRYQSMLIGNNAVDFDDLLMHAVCLLLENPELKADLDERYQQIMVDEYQDTNFAQYLLVRSLSVNHPNLTVTGDPDQSIYGWRGANLGNILKFEQDYPNVKVVRLEQNYRSTANILRVADRLIERNQRRLQKVLLTDNHDGLPVRLAEYAHAADEAEHIADRIAASMHNGLRRAGDYAIFYRVSAMSRSIETALLSRSIPYVVLRGVEFYQRKEVKDLLSYLHLINNPQNDVALNRIINVPRRGIGKVTLQRLTDHALRDGRSLLESARDCQQVKEISSSAAAKVAKFVNLFNRIEAHSLHTQSVTEILQYIIESTGIRDELECSERPEDQERAENIDELLAATAEFDAQHPEDGSLEMFLEQASLVSDTDEWDVETNHVTLMTLHAAKGLEFPVVYIVGLEEDTLPHQRAKLAPGGLEEERRLLFVGITRAMDELQLSWARKRFARGESRVCAPSCFLMDLPRGEMDDVKMSPSYGSQQRRNSPTARAKSRPKVDLPMKLMTAADMLGESEETPPESPTMDFQQGEMVRHPEYGIGQVIAVGGSDHKPSLKIRFGMQTRTIVLGHVALTPLRRERVVNE